MESNPKLRDNLFDLDNGYYLSKNDSLFWRKLLNRRPENGEAMYHVGLELERNAKNQLNKFYSTKIEKYLIWYRKIIKQSFELMSKSLNKGYFSARLDVLRMEREMILADIKISSIKDSSNYFRKKDIFLLALVVLAIIIIVCATFLLANKGSNIIHYSNNNYTYMLPYEVVDKKPSILPSRDYQQTTINIKRGTSKEALVNALLDSLKIEYEKDTTSAKQVIAVDENKIEIGMALWAGGDKNIQVYTYPSDSTVFIDDKERQLWETTTVVRSALYQFVKKNGYMPNDLHTLNQPFPNNYLTGLPKDPYKLKNNVTTSPNGDGGWLFSIVEITPNSDLISVVKQAVKPNIPINHEIPFVPLNISINKENHTLSVMSGDQIIRRYSTAVGKDDTTPEGNLDISKKVMHPDKIVPVLDNVYGTRAMELSHINYAVHGTNTPSSIGQDASQGCIRLNNSDMEDLYAIIPLNTSVNIFKNSATPKDFNNPDTSYNALYNHSDNSKEEDNSTTYHWSY